MDYLKLLFDWSTPRPWWVECLQGVVCGLLAGPLIVWIVVKCVG